MSEQKPKRFDTLNAIRQKPPVPEETPEADAAETPLPYSTYLLPSTKRRLKQVAARQDRKQFELVEQALLEFLDRHHPEVR